MALEPIVNQVKENNHESLPLQARRWAGIFLLTALEALAALGFLASLPSDVENSRFLGYSASRLLLMALLLALTVVFAGLAGRVYRSRQLGFLDPDHHAWVWKGLFVFLPLAALISVLVPVVLMSIYRTSGDFRYFAYYQRLLPLFIWLGLAALQLFAGLAWLGNFHWRMLHEQKRTVRAALLVWGIFGLIAIFAVTTGIGIVPDQRGWGAPAVSLLEWQIWLAWAVGSAFLLLLTRIGWNTRRDWLLAAAIWLLASALWLNQPIQTAFFATAGRAPNYEIYPFSDGAYYAQFAQSLLTGNGFKGDQVPARAYYVTLLAGFHALVGQKYENVIFLQTLLLAFFPVVLYFIGKEMHSRAAGLAVALLAILRELTAITSAPFTNKTSNSQLFFADLPTTLFVGLWALLMIRWLKTPHGDFKKPLIVGGAMGLAILFRTQSFFMMLAILALALIIYGRRWRAWLRALAWVVLGVVLVVTPWVLHNWVVTGRPVLDDDSTQAGVMAQRYSLEGQDDEYIYRAGEDAGTYSNKVTQGIVGFMLAHPDFVARFVSGHFINAQIDNVLLLPVRQSLEGLNELVSPTRAFWEDYQGALPPGQMLLFAINLGLIALGIGASQARLGWAGLGLLVMNLSYNFSNALARNSGFRYLLVVDWVFYLYAVIGLLEITVSILLVLGIKPDRLMELLAVSDDQAQLELQSTPKPRAALRKALGICLALCLIGTVPAVAELLPPDRYPDQTQAQLAAELNTLVVAQTGTSIELPSGAMLAKGRALYPRYYAAGEGEPRTAKKGYEPSDQARTVLLLASKPYNGMVLLKMDAAPTYLPNASDVIVLGCPVDDYMEAWMVVVLNHPGAVYRASEGSGQACPTAAK